SSIDRFILAGLERKGTAPSAPTGKRTLLRRATFDLIGLPPTTAEIDAFLADDSSGAFARVVDRLLASPQYGERWGRYWLDVVRYADTAGDNSDFPVPQMHLYRDWVIAAFNRDLPYDQFVRAQIAGDLLPGANEAARGAAQASEGRRAEKRTPAAALRTHLRRRGRRQARGLAHSAKGGPGETRRGHAPAFPHRARRRGPARR